MAKHASVYGPTPAWRGVGSPLRAAEGSNDTFAVVPKEQIIGVSNKLDVWLVENSGGAFGLRERIAWEGMKEAYQPWSYIHFKDRRSDG